MRNLRQSIRAHCGAYKFVTKQGRGSLVYPAPQPEEEVAIGREGEGDGTDIGTGDREEEVARPSQSKAVEGGQRGAESARPRPRVLTANETRVEDGQPTLPPWILAKQREKEIAQWGRGEVANAEKLKTQIGNQ